MPIAAYIDDPMGRRLVLTPPDTAYSTGEPIQIATTQTEAREVIRVLRELAQELPP